MKNLLRFLPVAALALASFSCDDKGQPEDPFDNKSSDRTPTAFTLEAQQGVAVIVDNPENDAVGTISVIIEVRDLDNISAVEVEDIRIPDTATATLKRGDKIDLSSGTASLTVTAENGSTRVYTISYSEPGRSAANSAATFALEGQVGDAVITDNPDDATKGTIALTLDVRGGNAQDVEITTLTVSPFAVASVEVGGTLDFTDYEATFTVTADDKTSVRTYTVIYTEPTRSSANSVTSFAIVDQMGVPEIVDSPSGATGTIAVNLPDTMTGAAEIEISELTVSALATPSVAVGAKLALTSGSATFTVTADDASVRTYTVNVSYVAPPDIEDIMEGTYKMAPRGAETATYGINAVWVEGGVGEGSGDRNAVFMSLNDKGSAWDGGRTAVERANAYTITIVALSETATTVSGSVTLSAPNDNFFSFKWGSTRTGDPSLHGMDMSVKYQLIPKGTSSWTRSKETNEVEFFDGSNASLGKCFFVPSGTEFVADNKNSITVTIGKSGLATAASMPDTSATNPNIHAFHRPFSYEDGQWNKGPAASHYGDESRFWHNCRRVLWLVEKQSE